MQSDGFCRLSTRAGSAPVVKRNWHWGPLVHQTYADSWSLFLSRAARQAIDDLAAGRLPRDPPKIDSYPRILNETVFDEKTHIYKKCKCCAGKFYSRCNDNCVSNQAVGALQTLYQIWSQMNIQTKVLAVFTVPLALQTRYVGIHIL